MKRLGFFILGMMAGLGSASIAYQTVALIGVAISGAGTLEEVNVFWFPVRAVVALRVARATGGWVYGLQWRD